jgi:hypothetical protein
MLSLMTLLCVEVYFDEQWRVLVSPGVRVGLQCSESGDAL